MSLDHLEVGVIGLVAGVLGVCRYSGAVNVDMRSGMLILDILSVKRCRRE